MVAPFDPAPLPRLVELGRRIRDRVVGARERHGEGWARPIGRNRADIQFALDQLAERGLREDIQEVFSGSGPLRLVCEGLSAESEVIFEGDGGQVLIIDPVDGTRGLMHDKRSAFALLALASDGPAASLSQILQSCMVEIPSSRSQLSDVLVADHRGHLDCFTENLVDHSRVRFVPGPSTALDLRHGFGTLVRYCSGAGTAFGLFEDDFLRSLFAGEPEATQEIYEDQFICNGGQMHALITGRDRFVADLRPLFVTREGLSLTASHPYDLCAWLIAQQSGVVITDATGRQLDAPLDTVSRVAWVGYASEQLRQVIEPHLLSTLREHELIGD